MPSGVAAPVTPETLARARRLADRFLRVAGDLRSLVDELDGDARKSVLDEFNQCVEARLAADASGVERLAD